MSPLRQALYGLALLATLALLLWTQHLRSQAESARAERDGQALQQARERIERQAQTITQLDQALQAERTAQAQLRTLQAQLRTLQAQLRQGLAQRERTLKELTHADPDLRTWSALPLPAAARRLRERPALSGADAYRDWLSRSGAVQPTGDGTGQ